MILKCTGMHMYPLYVNTGQMFHITLHADTSLGHFHPYKIPNLFCTTKTQ